MKFTIEDKSAILLIVFSIVLLLFVYNGSALEKNGITVKLISNTDRCEYCKTVYNVCLDNILTSSKITDYKFLFSNELLKEQNTLSSLKSVPNITYKLDKTGLCYDVTISAKKSPFANIDNILCFKDVCFNEFVWWNSTYKKCVKITNSTASFNGFGEEIEFQFTNAQIPYKDFMVNFTDMRFTNGTDCNIDSGSNMSYVRHIERVRGYCNTSDTTTPCRVYINSTIENITTFLMYYNATGVAWENNILAVTDFDDFNDNDMSDWTISAGTWTVENGIIKSTNTGNNQYITRNFLTGKTIKTLNNKGFVFDVDMLINGTAYGQNTLLLNNTALPTYVGMAQIVGTSTNVLITQFADNNGTLIQGYFGTQTTNGNQWYHYKLIWLNLNQTLFRDDIKMGDVKTIQTSPLFVTKSSLYQSGGSGSRYSWFDNIIVRNYMATVIWNISSPEINLPVNCSVNFNIFDNVTSEHLNNSFINCIPNNFSWSGNSPTGYINMTNANYNCDVNATGYYGLNWNFTCLGDVYNISSFLGEIIIPPRENYTFGNVSNKICCPDWTLATKSICSDNSTLYQEYNEYHCLNGLCENATAFRYVNCPYGCVVQIDNMGDGCIVPNYQLDFMFIAIILGIIIIFAIIWKRK